MDEKKLDLSFGESKNPEEIKQEGHENGNAAKTIIVSENHGKYDLDESDIANIQIAAVQGPVIVFYGPRDIGKTVALLRLSQYIGQLYDIEPNPFFKKGDLYIDAIKQFKHIKNSNLFAPDATGTINYMLLDLKSRNKGNVEAQFLEVPGEHFFDPEDPNRPYPDYLNRIFNENYRKIYVFFFEMGMLEPEDRGHYAAKVSAMLKRMRPKDKAITVCNKADLYEYIDKKGNLNVSQYKAALTRDFGRIIGELDDKNAAFIPFSAGFFGKDNKGRKTFGPSRDEYPKMLWNAVLKALKGGFFS